MTLLSVEHAGCFLRRAYRIINALRYAYPSSPPQKLGEVVTYGSAYELLFNLCFRFNGLIACACTRSQTLKSAALAPPDAQPSGILHLEVGLVF